MLTRINKAMAKKDSGFTLIELLVVMIIIGILAAIAIPVFLNQRATARDTAVKADVSNLGKEIAAYYVDGDQALDGLTAPATGYTISFGTDPDVVAGTPSAGVVPATVPFTYVSSTNWCVALTNPEGRVDTFSYSATAGLRDGAC